MACRCSSPKVPTFSPQFPQKPKRFRFPSRAKRGSPCGRTGARKSLEEKRRESSSQGWVGDQKTVVALKWNEAKAAERRITQGRRLSRFVVRSLPAHQRVSHAGSGWHSGGSGSARTGGRGKRVEWRSGVSWRERSEGASRRPQYGRALSGAGLRAMRPRIGPRARRHGSGGEGPGAVDAVYCAPVGGPKGK